MRQQDIPGSGPLRRAARGEHSRAASGLGQLRWRTVWLASAAVTATALSVAACGSSSPSSSGPASAPPSAASRSASSGSALDTTAIAGTTVLTNAQGFTVYMFAPDTGTASKCYGACAGIWPAVTGPVTAGPGITGTLGTITRTGGATQATYNGHPLYTYAGDTRPGQAKGNGIKGVWHVVTPGTAALSGSGLGTTAIGGTTVLTNAQGFTVYMFAPDTGTTSKCTGTCAQIWPPVTGPVTAGPGITGTLGTITRTGGATQATYNGHPLYTYAGDTRPGQAKGNGIKGVWHVVTPGTAVVASSGGTSGNGY